MRIMRIPFPPFVNDRRDRLPGQRTRGLESYSPSFPVVHVCVR